MYLAYGLIASMCLISYVLFGVGIYGNTGRFRCLVRDGSDMPVFYGEEDNLKELLRDPSITDITTIHNNLINYYLVIMLV